MGAVRNVVATVALLCGVAACSESPQDSVTHSQSLESERRAVQQSVEVETGVSEALARSRSARISNVDYQLHFDLPATQDEPVRGRAVITFDLADAEQALLLDFKQSDSGLVSVVANEDGQPAEVRAEHVVLSPSALRAGRNSVTLEFIAADTALNRNPDFLYTLFVPDRARTAFPAFDQPDLKATFAVSLSLPAHWQALANTPEEQVTPLEGGRKEVTFARSRPISTYLFAFVAGDFQVVQRQLGDRQMRMLHRETDTERVARNSDAIFTLHAESLDWMERYTGIEYPFEKFDFVLLPGYPFGGMEHVGAIQYRSSSLFLDESATLPQRLNRARLIAHETAHTWFGNLVTMRWFDDVWTKEVFANFMADKIVNPAFPDVDHALSFLLDHYPPAYAVDRSEGANAIRQPLANLDQAGSLYGSIIYHKAPIMMRQLEMILGEEGLRQGLAEYLQRFAFANASWPDLIVILDEHTDIDLASWSEVWVNTPGRPHFVLVADEGGEFNTPELAQEDPAGLGRTWPQRFDLLSLTDVGAGAISLMADDVRTTIPQQPIRARLFNADGRGYGLFPLDLDMFDAWDELEPVQKGSLLIIAYDQLLEGSEPAPPAYAQMLLELVQRETDPLLLAVALDQLSHVYLSLLGEPGALRTELEDILWSTMLAQDDASRRKLVFNAVSRLASSEPAVQLLYEVWSGELKLDLLPLEEEDRLTLAQTLAIRMPDKAGAILARQYEALSNPDRQRRLAFVRPSLSPEQADRDAFFESLHDARNRHTERWVIEGLRNLHHPARLKVSEKYLGPSLEMLEDIQRTGDIFFPGNWLQATLGHYHSKSAQATVRDFLERRPQYNPQLRMKILQASDSLFRAVSLRHTQ